MERGREFNGKYQVHSHHPMNHVGPGKEIAIKPLLAVAQAVEEVIMRLPTRH